MTTMTTTRRDGIRRRWRRHDGDSATGDEVNDDGDGTMSDDGDGATGNEVDDDGDDDKYGNGRRRRWQRRDGGHVDGDGTTGNEDDDDGSS
jgi:hypothetical protein